MESQDVRLPESASMPEAPRCHLKTGAPNGRERRGCWRQHRFSADDFSSFCLVFDALVKGVIEIKDWIERGTVLLETQFACRLSIHDLVIKHGTETGSPPPRMSTWFSLSHLVLGISPAFTAICFAKAFA